MSAREGSKVSARRGGAGPVALATIGGLAVAGGSTGSWVIETVRTDLGGVARTDELVTPGVELAGVLLPVGVAAVVAGLAIVAARGRLRLALAISLSALGLAALIATGIGAAAGARLDGELGPAVYVTGVGALAVAASGALALRPAVPPRLPARFDLEPDAEDEADAEWRMASAEGESETEGPPEGQVRR